VPAARNETASYRLSGQLIQRDLTGATNPQPATLNYAYDASGNMTNATGGGQTWDFTYDEDNRVRTVGWKLGALLQKAITNRYDAFGRRIARTVDGVETRYVLDLAGVMERILCDVTTSGAITGWYVHGADLAFKVAPDGSLTCYHADAQGNVIALTDGGATSTAQFAYTPYGRSLGSTGTPAAASNPFLFVGSQGVMMEERGVPGLYFMRARYYSAELGVFLSTDPVKNIGPTWRPIAYAYANGNPCRYNDPEGELFNFVAAAVGAVAGAVVGGGLDAVYQYATTGEVDWSRVAGAAVAGAITGGVAGLTMGASLGVQLAAAGVAGGVATIAGRGTANLISGQSFFNDLTAGEVMWGVVGGAAGAGLGRAIGGPGSKLFGAASKTQSAFREALRNSVKPQMLKQYFVRGSLGGGFSALKSEAPLGGSKWGERDAPNQPGPSAPAPSVWHPSSSPVFMGCDCGN
jgi:RHS repeat-associated protein